MDEGEQLRCIVENFLASQGKEGKGKLVFCAVVGAQSNNLRHSEEGKEGVVHPWDLPGSEIYGVYVVPTETLLGLAAMDVVLKERTLLSPAGAHPVIRVDEAAKFCNLSVEGTIFRDDWERFQ